MGCDIHCYVEYRTPRHRPGSSWSDFGGRINPGRNYRIFEQMAGVRAIDEKNAVVPPRGLPDDIGYAASGDAWVWIDYDGHHCDCGESNSVDPDTAARWADYRDDGKGYRYGYDDAAKVKPLWVAGPDWHSHSWLTPSEFATALERAGDDATPHDEPEYYALLAAMRALEGYGNEVRLVFWFDN